MILEYFTAPWCAPCKTMLPMIEDVCKEAGIEIRLWDYSNEYGKHMIENKNILSFPSMILNDGGGYFVTTETKRHTGAMGRGDFERWIKGEE